METKTCTKCNTPNDIEQFSFKSIKKNLRHSWCKTCAATEKTAWYQRNRRAHILKNRARGEEYRKQNELNLINYLEQHPCIDCGEECILVLEFDHEKQEDKIDSISQLLTNRCSWKTILKEIEKCSVRCANCHRKKTAKQSNNYKYKYISQRRH